MVRCYGPLAKTFFSDLKQTSGDGCFKVSKMEKVIKEIVDGGMTNQLSPPLPVEQDIDP